MSAKKVGRPTDSVKNHMLRARMDEDVLYKLDGICRDKSLTRSEVVRELIESYEPSKMRTVRE